MDAVRGAQIVAPWLNLGGLRRQAQTLINEGRGRAKIGRAKTQGVKASVSIPVEQWPESHRCAWISALAAMRSVCVEDEDDPMARYTNEQPLAAFSKNEGTRRNCAHAWACWLYVMSKKGQSWEITKPRIDQFVESCLAREGCSRGGVANYLSSIMFMLRIVAPETNAAMIDAIRDRRDKEKKAHGLGVPMEILQPSKLAGNGLGLMVGAESRPLSSRSAIEYRDGCLMWFGTIIPARSINLGGMRLGKDVFLDDRPRIEWTAEDIKGRVAHSYPLPEEVVERLRIMWNKYRPMLMGDDAVHQDWFWGPRRGGSGHNRGLTPQAINRIISGRTANSKEGKRVTGYSRRHSVATMFAEEAPEHIDQVTPRLQQGHHSSKSFYTRRAKKVSATKLSAACMASLRERFR